MTDEPSRPLPREPDLPPDDGGRFDVRHVAAALAISLLIIGCAIFLAGLVTALMAESLGSLEGPRRTLTFLLVMQAAIAALSVAAAGLFGPRETILTYASPRGGLRDFGVVLAVMAGVLGLYTFFAMQWFPDLVQRDLAQFRPVLADEYALAAFVALAIGAPLSEELLFRGFLMGVLRRSWLGYSGAALAATFGWTALHWGYSPVGLIEVFIAGLIFSWALWRTGSIIVPLVCHGLYNATVLVILWSFSFAG